MCACRRICAQKRAMLRFQRAADVCVSWQGNDFEGLGGLLGGSMRRLSKLTASGGSKVMCYLIGFVVSVFFVIWYLIR